LKFEGAGGRVVGTVSSRFCSFSFLGSWFLVLGSWFLVLGSWFLVLAFFLVLGSSYFLLILATSSATPFRSSSSSVWQGRRRSIASEGQVFHAQANIEREREDKPAMTGKENIWRSDVDGRVRDELYYGEGRGGEGEGRGEEGGEGEGRGG